MLLIRVVFCAVATSPSISSPAVVTSGGATTTGPTSLAPAALRELYGSAAAAAAATATSAPGHPLASLVSQQRFLELSRFGLRHYDLAQHMLTQQGAVTKLLGK